MIEKESLVGFDKHDYAPMLREESAKLLVKILKGKKPQNILEIGTFLGYSAALILQTCPNAHLTTIEKSQENACDAMENLKNLGLATRCSVVCCDAMDFLQQTKNENYDLIFLDGPKGQYNKYLPYLKEMLKSGGVLIADDILFYGYVKSQEKIEHKHRSIVNNLRKFLNEITTDRDFDTQIFEIEDGVSVSIKK